MTGFLKFFVLLFVLTQICVGDDTEFTAFCDLCRIVNDKTECPSESLKCDGEAISYDGITGTCTGAHITNLRASKAGLEKVPESLNKMTYLKTLNLASNNLTGLPNLTALTALEALYLHNNQLKTINGVFINSKKLNFVLLSNNKLTELPKEFGNFPITNLQFDDNEISSIPEEYKSLTKLKTLKLSGNYLDCSNVSTVFGKTSVFAESCIQAQQKTEDEYPELPTSFSTEPPNEGLDGYEVASIILFVIFVVGLVLTIVFYVRYRNGGIKA